MAEYKMTGPGDGRSVGRLNVCSSSVVVTAYDFESGRLGSNPEWGQMYYKVSITAQGLPEPSSLFITFGTRAVEHKSCNWACNLMQVDLWLQPKKLCSATRTRHFNSNNLLLF